MYWGFFVCSIKIIIKAFQYIQWDKLTIHKSLINFYNINVYIRLNLHYNTVQVIMHF